MHVVFFIISMLNLDFKGFERVSTLGEFYLKENEVKGIDYLTLFPEGLDFSYQMYKLNGMGEFYSYYQVDVPILSVKAVYLPFLLHRGRRINHIALELSYFKAKKSLLVDYVKLWFMAKNTELLDSIIRYKKTLLRFSTFRGISDEAHFMDEITLKRELLDLQSERKRWHAKLIELLKKHDICIDTPLVFREDMDTLFWMYQQLNDSIEVLNERLLRYKLDFARLDRTKDYLSILPRLTYTTMHQFEGLSPTSIRFNRAISGFMISISFDPIRFIEDIKHSNKVVGELNRRLRKQGLDKTLRHKLKKQNIEKLRQKIGLLNEVEEYYKKETKLYKKGKVDIKSYTQLKLYFLNFKKEVLMDFYEMITNKE